MVSRLLSAAAVVVVVLVVVFGIQWVLPKLVPPPVPPPAPPPVQEPALVRPLTDGDVWFNAGDCLVSVGAERWEEPIIVRIEEVGRSMYRIRHWQKRSWAADWALLSFYSQSIYKRVACPTP